MILAVSKLLALLIEIYLKSDRNYLKMLNIFKKI